MSCCPRVTVSSLLVCFALISRHMLTFIRYIEVYFTFGLLVCVRYKEVFVISRFVISRFCSIHFTVILAGLKKIVIPRTSLYRGSLNRGSTVTSLQ